MAKLLSKERVEETSSTGGVEREQALLKDVKDIVESFRSLYDMAYDAYLPLVDDICSRESPENEVEYLLDCLLDFAGEERMLLPYKRVCREYFYQYPEMVANHIYMWRDMYDKEYEVEQ